MQVKPCRSGHHTGGLRLNDNCFIQQYLLFTNLTNNSSKNPSTDLLQHDGWPSLFVFDANLRVSPDVTFPEEGYFWGFVFKYFRIYGADGRSFFYFELALFKKIKGRLIHD